MKETFRLGIPYEPKYQNRWMVTLPKEIDIAIWALCHTSRPKISFDENNNPIYFPIEMDFFDPIGPSTSQRLFMLTEAYKYKKPSWFRRIVNKITGKEIKPHYMYENLMQYVDGFDYELCLLDPTGITVEKWLIRGCKIVNIDFGDLCYSKDEQTIVKMIIQPKDFILLF